jgi:hypothetical protein
MTAWILPVVGAAFWAGLLARPLLGDRMPVWSWLVAGLVALASSLVLVPADREAPDPLAQAGLVKPDEEPRAVAAVTVGRRRAGRGSPAAPFLATLGVFLLAVGWGGAHAHKLAGSLLARLATERVTVHGVLRTDPSAQISGWSAVIDAGQVEWRDEAAAVHESLWVQGRDRPPPAVRGDRVLLEGQILVPEDREFADALARRAIAAEIRVTTFRRLGPSANPFVRAAQSFRSFVGRSIARLFPPREAGLLMGLALGDDSRLDPALARDFQATGLGHLLVVSGENDSNVIRSRRGGRLSSPSFGCLVRPRIGVSACRAQKPRIGTVTRSFFEFARPVPPRRPRWGIQTVHQARHLFSEHCRATPNPMAPLSRASLDEETRW